MLGFMDLMWPRVFRRSNVGLVFNGYHASVCYLYAFLTSSENTTWFCVHCKEGTLETLEAGAQIKKRCQMIQEKYDEKLKDIEVAIESKAYKTDLNNVKADQLVHANQIAGLARDVSNWETGECSSVREQMRTKPKY